MAFPVDYTSKALFLGSCFATNMAAKFEYFALPHTVNPFGVLFNPIALEQLIVRAINQELFTIDDLQRQDDIWYCFMAHSSCNGIESTEVLTGLNNALSQLYDAIKSSTHIVLTFGTAWVYRHIATDQIVANCHKVANKEFVKELLTPDQITQSVEAIVSLIRSENNRAVFINSVSPVRHIKDSLEGNSRSKAHLLAGTHAAIEDSTSCYYFPSYELLMDELRDYRYYESDLIHPNQQAIDHVWDCFKQAWVHPDAIIIANEIDGLRLAMNHRPIVTQSNASKAFKMSLEKKLTDFRNRFPGIKF